MELFENRYENNSQLSCRKPEPTKVMPQGFFSFWTIPALLILTFFACQSSYLSPAEFQLWMQKHSRQLQAEVVQDTVRYQLFYLPADWLALREKKGNAEEKSFEEIRKEYGNLEYYRFRIEVPGFQREILQYNAAGTDQYYERVEYCSFERV